ncbi:MAG: substrate-binding domain-containing protein [Verrucomicrobia bacterium]|nr:substrate-binding domain-containing protein [Verrucomicrobiota bacterium]
MEPAELPRRTTLISQTIAVLESGLKQGRWVEHLPGQHELCQQLAISRTTLRAALRVLARRDRIDLRQGRPMVIRHPAAPAGTVARPARVVVLVPAPLWRLRPSVAHWVSDLRSLVERANLEFILSEGGQHYSAKPEAPLARLLQSHPRSAWILFASTRAMQAWFGARGAPALLVGSAFPGIELPSIEYDHAAIAQHAATLLANAGHRRTAILLQRTGSAADATTCGAFAAARRPDSPPPLVLEHDGTMAQIESRLRRLAAWRDRPTALFVTKTLAVPAAYTVLARLGLAIPRDLSVICREDDPFLEYLAPAVARYRSDSAVIARQLMQAIARLAGGQALAVTHQRLMPRFIDGASVAPPVRGA